MNKIFLLLAVATLLVDASGCGGRRLFGAKAKPVAAPIVTQYVPSCAPSCDACGSATPVTSGTASPTFAAPPAYSSSPMTLPAQMPVGSGSR